MAQPNESLYNAGWRQGTIFEHQLHLCVNRLSQVGLTADLQAHDRWIVASQDCDLAGAALDSRLEIEVWPLSATDEVVAASLRNRKFGVKPGWMLTHPSARGYIEARALATINPRAEALDDRTQRRLKTWLGRRYDRPALPREYEIPAKAIAAAVKSLRDRETDRHVRDVLMVFIAADPLVIDLYAVVNEESTGELERVERWLSEIAAKLGEKTPLRAWRAVPESLTSLLLVEHSYPADLSQITVDDEEQRANVHS